MKPFFISLFLFLSMYGHAQDSKKFFPAMVGFGMYAVGLGSVPITDNHFKHNDDRVFFRNGALMFSGIGLIIGFSNIFQENSRKVNIEQTQNGVGLVYKF
jgi:hypothetical protein